MKTQQFALPKARSNSCAKIIKHNAIKIWSRIPLEMKNKRFWALFLQNIRNMYYSAAKNKFCVLFIGVHEPGVH